MEETKQMPAKMKSKAKVGKPRYEPYVSKSDRPKGIAKELKAMGRMGNIAAMQMANEMLSPKSATPKKRPLNQRQKRKRARQS